MTSTKITARLALAVLLTAAAALPVAYIPAAHADDRSDRQDSSQDSGDHHFVKDSVITTKVKSKLAAKHMSTLTRVRVDTDANGVVFLSGSVPTKDERDLAGMIAKDTDGVRSVKNNIEVAPH